MNSNRKYLAIALASAVICAAPARADYVVKDGNGNLQTIKAGVISGSILPIQTPVDQSGNPFGVTANPIFVAPGSGQTFPISGTIACSNCSGSGVSVNFGGVIGAVGTPGGFKDGSGNFQPNLGDVTNGQWVSIKSSVSLGVTGTFWPYTLGQQVVGSSVPVALPAAQITTLTPPTTVTVQQPTGTNLHMVCDSGCSSSSSPSFGATFPTTGTPIGMSQGGLLTAFTGTGGNLNINIASGNITGFSTSANQSSQLTQETATAAAAGTTADAVYTGTGNATLVAALKGVFAQQVLTASALNNGLPEAPVASTTTESGHVLKGSAGNLLSLTTTISTGSGWLMLFDATTVPADGAVTPKWCRYIKSDGTGGATSLAWHAPLSFTTGISAAFSSTGCFTKTASATAAFSGQVQ